MSALGWDLPPGVSDRDIDGPEEEDEDGLTARQRREEEIGEDKADLAREEGPGEEDGPWAEGWAERAGEAP